MGTKRHRGGQPDNQNARKHGFYSRAFKKKDRFELDLASGMEGIDAEIALLRLEMKKAVSGADVKNLAPLVKTALALEKLLRTRQKYFSPEDDIENKLKDAMQNFIQPLIAQLIKLPDGEKSRDVVGPAIDNNNQNT
jgi:hypothetical protein